MDEICKALAEKIYAVSKNAYGIFYEDELSEAIPSGNEDSATAVKSALAQLEKEGYIDVKYSRGSAYCLKGLKAFEEEKIDLNNAVSADISANERKIYDFRPLLFSFIGALMGSILSGLVLRIL